MGKGRAARPAFFVVPGAARPTGSRTGPRTGGRRGCVHGAGPVFSRDPLVPCMGVSRQGPTRMRAVWRPPDQRKGVKPVAKTPFRGNTGVRVRSLGISALKRNPLKGNEMVNDYLRTERIPKSYAATDVLKTFGWPKPSHQKIVQKSYNAKFRKTAPTADTVLTAPADFSFPRMNPKQFADFKKKLGELKGVYDELTRFREGCEAELKRHTTSIKKVEDAYKRYNKHLANANKLAKRCVDDLKACGIQSPTLLFSERQADFWLDQVKILKKTQKDDLMTEGGRETLQHQIKDLKKGQAEVMKDILTQMARIAGASVVMP